MQYTLLHQLASLYIILRSRSLLWAFLSSEGKCDFLYLFSSKLENYGILKLKLHSSGPTREMQR
jgi:hypothetical protein